MRKLLILFIIFIPNTSFSNEKFVNYLKEGKKIIFMRHALAPGTADPKNFNINDCTTQRNLNEEGIRIDKVLSSEWCRCKDTANIAFGNFQTFSALNSFYEARFAKNKSKQIKELKNFLNNWESDSNLIIVTHFVVISELLNKGTSSGEMILTDKKLTILGNLEIN